eukprot:m.82727 g.82727  ORF g.82727 m.82727 type:complete len:149 (-) comp21070_c0_seq3:1161-1607(-)
MSQQKSCNSQWAFRDSFRSRRRTYAQGDTIMQIHSLSCVVVDVWECVADVCQSCCAFRCLWCFWCFWCLPCRDMAACLSPPRAMPTINIFLLLLMAAAPPHLALVPMGLVDLQLERRVATKAFVRMVGVNPASGGLKVAPLAVSSVLL